MNDQLINDAIARAGDTASQYAGSLQGDRYTGTHLQGGSSAVKAPAVGGFSAGNLLKSAGNLITSGAKAVYHSAVDAPKALGEYLSGAEHAGYQNTSLAKASDSALRAQQELTKAYQSGRITKDAYSKGLKDLTKQQLDTSKQAQEVSKSVGTIGERAKAAVDTATTVATVAAPELKTLATAAEGEGLLAKSAGVVADTIGAGKGSVPGKLVRNALISQPTAAVPGQIVGDVKNKNYGDLALQAGTLVGLPAAGKYVAPAVTDALGVLKSKAFGEAGSLINGLKFNDGTISDFVSTLSGTTQQRYEKIARQVQQHMVDEKKSVNSVVNYYSGGNQIGEQSAKDFLDQASKHIAADRAAVKAGQAGQLAFETKGQTVIAARWDNATRQAAVEGLQAGKSVDQLMKEGIIPNNPNLIKEIEAKVAAGGPEALTKIHAAPTTLKSKSAELEQLFTETGGAPDTFAKQGHGDYVFSRGPAGSANYRTPSQTAELVAGKSAEGVLGKAGTALTRAGLSPVANQGSIMPAVKTSLKNEFGESGAKILNVLNDNLKASTGAFDPRLLSKTEISTILGKAGIDVNPAQVRAALDRAYSNLSLADRGAGPKLVDKLIKNVPGMRQYLRIQSAGKFGINPFFAGKVAIKSGILAAGEADSVALLGRASQEAENFAAKIMSGRVVGEGAEDFLGTTAAVKPGLVGRFQQKLSANMVDKIAKTNGTTVEKALAENGELAKQMQHAVESVVGYPKGGYLDSNLAKTLNIAVFPSRFETKIATAGVKYLAKQPPVTRAVLINHLLNARTWVESPEGEKWKEQNSELVDAMNYFTPTHTLQQFMDFLGKGQKIGDLGQIAGLPLGVIAQIINNQGVNTGALGGSEGVKTKTGQPYAQKLPVTPTARLQQAGTDLVSSLFGWPGSTLGLQSKTDLIQHNVPGLKPVKGGFKTAGTSTSTGAGTSPKSPQPRVIQGISASKAPSVPSRVDALASKTQKAPRQKSLKILPRNLQLPR